MGAVETVEALSVSRERVSGLGAEARAVPARPLPGGPGRPTVSSRRLVRARSHAGAVRAGGPVREAGRSSAARPVAIRPAPRAVPVSRRGAAAPHPVAPAARWRGPLAAVAVVVVAALVVVALGLLAEAARAARVPDAVAPVRVAVGESLWGVARRVAPSADPGAVAARIVELNGLGSPSVQPGEVLLSPIG